jgi:predicted metal-dependent hydrolase
VIEESRQQLGLAGGPIPYLLRRSPRSRGIRLTIDDRLGLVVSVPPPGRRGWARPEDRVEAFIRERERWIRRHLRQSDQRRAEAAAFGGARDGNSVLYLGRPHRIRVIAAAPGARRTTVDPELDDRGEAIVIRTSPRERRSVARILEAWFRERANDAISHAVAKHAGDLGVTPAVITLRDPSSRWGSASRKGRLMLSWRLILAPSEALETVVVHELAHLRVSGHGPAFWKLVASRRPSHLADRAWLRRHSHALHAALDVASEAESIAG